MPAKIIQRNTKRFKKVKVDTVTLDIIESALRNARFEMDAVLFRTAMSPGIREQHDEFPLIADREGRMVVGQFGSFIGGFLQGYDGTIEEGDIFLTTDPYSVRRRDQPRQRLADADADLPDGRLIAWAAMFGHMTDVGGKVPGTLPTDAAHDLRGRHHRSRRSRSTQGRAARRTCSDHAAQLPAAALEPLRLQRDRGGLRTASGVHRDVRALRRRRVLFGAGRRCWSATSARCAADPEHGAGEEAVLRGLRLRRRARAWARTRSPARCGARANKCIFDFAGTDPQSNGSINFYLNEEMFKMFFGIYMIMVFDPQILFNDGFYDLIEVRIPGRFAVEALSGSALVPHARARPHLRHARRAARPGQAGIPVRRGLLVSPHFMYSGYDNERRVVPAVPDRLRRHSGRPFGDGPDGHSLWPSFTNVPNEFLEAISRCASNLRDRGGSGGPGMYRGGNGIAHRLPFPGAGRNLDPRRSLVHLSLGRQRRPAGRAQPQDRWCAPMASKECCPRSATGSRSNPAIYCTSYLGWRRLGRSVRARDRQGEVRRRGGPGHARVRGATAW